MISMPKININTQWLIPVATAIWAVWTWAADRKRERDDERARISALYVNPFLSACEDLQSRIYSILERGGLRTLRKRYPDGSYAEETLYLIVRYFGWMVAVERHGPYTQDPVVMRLMSSISSAFAAASSAQQVGPFNFFHPEQKDLGKLVMTTIVESDNLEPDTISCHEFKKRLASPPWSDSESVKETLEALRSADDAGQPTGSRSPCEGSESSRRSDWIHRSQGGVHPVSRASAKSAGCRRVESRGRHTSSSAQSA